MESSVLVSLDLLAAGAYFLRGTKEMMIVPDIGTSEAKVIKMLPSQM